MSRKRDFQTGIIAVLAVAVLFMTIGFAAYSQVLTINGTVKVSPNKWSVHFDTTSYAETAGSVQATSVTLNETTMSYEVSFDQPGDVYEFDVDVMNDGTFDAKLIDLTMGGLTTAQDKYIDYVVTYDGTPYNGTTTGINNLIPATNGLKRVHVKVSYVAPDDPADLPDSEVSINLTASFSYQQA